MFAIRGGFLVVVDRAFSPSVVGWPAFGVGSGIILIAALAQLDSGPGCAQRILDGATVVVSALLAGLSLNEGANWRLGVGLGNLRWLPGGPLREPAMQHRRAA